MKITSRQLRRIIREAIDDADGGQARIVDILKQRATVLADDIPLSDLPALLEPFGYHVTLQSYHELNWISVTSGPGMFHPIEISDMGEMEDINDDTIVVGNLAVSQP